MGDFFTSPLTQLTMGRKLGVQSLRDLQLMGSLFALAIGLQCAGKKGRRRIAPQRRLDRSLRTVPAVSVRCCTSWREGSNARGMGLDADAVVTGNAIVPGSADPMKAITAQRWQPVEWRILNISTQPGSIQRKIKRKASNRECDHPLQLAEFFWPHFRHLSDPSTIKTHFTDVGLAYRSRAEAHHKMGASPWRSPVSR